MRLTLNFTALKLTSDLPEVDRSSARSNLLLRKGRQKPDNFDDYFVLNLVICVVFADILELSSASFEVVINFKVVAWNVALNP